jgi:hypothetical protein
MIRIIKLPRLRWALLATMVFLSAYVGSYFVLSRRGMAQMKGTNVEVLYFFPPEDTDSWRAWNYGCVTVYYPLIEIEIWLGTIKGVGCEPLWKLSDRREGQSPLPAFAMADPCAGRQRYECREQNRGNHA